MKFTGLLALRFVTATAGQIVGPLSIPKEGTKLFDIVQLGTFPDPEFNFIDSDQSKIRGRAFYEETRVEIWFNNPNNEIVAWGSTFNVDEAAGLHFALETTNGNSPLNIGSDGFVGFVLQNEIARNIVLTAGSESNNVAVFEISNILFAQRMSSTPTLPPSAMKGDPHVKTWGGRWIDYQGECDLVFVQAPAFGLGVGLDIHARTTIRHGYSFIESVALKIGDDILEVDSFGGHAVNGVEGANLEDLTLPNKNKMEAVTFGGFPIYKRQPEEKKTIFHVLFSATENITITTFKDMVNIEIEGGYLMDFKSSGGILGSIDGLLLGRDGLTIFELDDINAFGQEWQVRDDEPQLFRTSRSPQYPKEMCRLPPGEQKKKTSIRSRQLARVHRQLGAVLYSSKADWEAAVMALGLQPSGPVDLSGFLSHPLEHFAPSAYTAAWYECADLCSQGGEECPASCLDLVLANDGSAELQGPNSELMALLGPLGEQVKVYEEVDDDGELVLVMEVTLNTGEVGFLYWSKEQAHILKAYQIGKDGERCGLIYEADAAPGDPPIDGVCSPSRRQLVTMPRTLQSTPCRDNWCDLCESDYAEYGCASGGVALAALAAWLKRAGTGATVGGISLAGASTAATTLTLVCALEFASCKIVNCNPWERCGQECIYRECCGGTSPIYNIPANQNKKCCGSNIIDQDQCCPEEGEKECNGGCIDKLSCCDCDKRCCNLGDSGHCLDDAFHACCPDERDPDTGCCPGKTNCGGTCLEGAAEIYDCCRGSIDPDGNPYLPTQQGCCEGKIFDPSTHECCNRGNGALRRIGEPCCDDQSDCDGLCYDPDTHGCCDGVKIFYKALQTNPDGHEGRDECCNKGSGVLKRWYNPCCDDENECGSGSGRCFEKESQDCCNGETIFEKDGNRCCRPPSSGIVVADNQCCPHEIRCNDNSCVTETTCIYLNALGESCGDCF